MNLHERFPVRPEKIAELLARIDRLEIDASKIEESFVKGGGPGGQKINKTESAVQLRYEPLALVVRCQRERSRSLNRFLALRELVDRIEDRVSPGTSERLAEAKRLRDRKKKRRKKAVRKAREPQGEGGAERQ